MIGQQTQSAGCPGAAVDAEDRAGLTLASATALAG